MRHALSLALTHLCTIAHDAHEEHSSVWHILLKTLRKFRISQFPMLLQHQIAGIEPPTIYVHDEHAHV